MPGIVSACWNCHPTSIISNTTSATLMSNSRPLPVPYKQFSEKLIFAHLMAEIRVHHLFLLLGCLTISGHYPPPLPHAVVCSLASVGCLCVHTIKITDKHLMFCVPVCVLSTTCFGYTEYNVWSCKLLGFQTNKDGWEILQSNMWIANVRR